MKIAHMSDLHYCPENLVEADRCFGFAVDDAIERDVELAIISGDSTDHRLDAHSPALLALARRIKQLADHCPVLMLQGTFSHEPVGMLRMLELIGAHHPIAVADRIGQMGLTHDNCWRLADPSEPTQSFKAIVSCVPTVSKADLALLVGAENAATAMGEHLASLLVSFAPSHETYRAWGIPTVLTSHGTLDGSLNESGVPMAGLDHEFSAGALFAANADAVMLGHIHKGQIWQRHHAGREQLIAYPGSIGRFHYGEIGDKYYLVWDIKPGAPAVEQVVTPSRKMIDIDFDGVPDLAKLAEVAKDCAGAYVRLSYKVDEEFAQTVDRQAIKQILGGCAEVKVIGEVLTIQRQRCAGISTLPSLTEKFLQWCQATGTDSTDLVERLSDLQIMSADEIASRFNRQSTNCM